MRDIPGFTTNHGIASLTLQEIPYRQQAYIRIQCASDGQALLRECVDFCRACGAEEILATGHEVCEEYPLYTQILSMQAQAISIPQTDGALFPVQEKTVSQWQEIYNRKMRNVPNSATMTQRACQELLEEGSGYFVHRGDTLLGIGKASGDRIDAVISLMPGAGKAVVGALCNALSSDRVCLEVASTNSKALSLYQGLGFLQTGIVSSWYRVFG